jgi:hypothetical protein
VVAGGSGRLAVLAGFRIGITPDHHGGDTVTVGVTEADRQPPARSPRSAVQRRRPGFGDGIGVGVGGGRRLGEWIR